MTREIIQDGLEADLNIDELRQRLGAPNNPTLFPPHFLKSTFPKIGGKVVVFDQDADRKIAAFLFPRSADGNFTIRISQTGTPAPSSEILDIFKSNGITQGYFYNPDDDHLFKSTHKTIDGLDIGKPDVSESEQIRRLQKEIWGSTDDYLYPYDIHSNEFKMATSLVARQNEKVVGFLFGFYKYGHSLPDSLSSRYNGGFRIESQLMGVLEDSRFKGVGTKLKIEQAEIARKDRIDIVNWTVDPLLVPNAILNFNKLGGICYEYHQNYYQFQNALNQVSTSRFAITWLINSDRVKTKVDSLSKDNHIQNIQRLDDLTIVNNGVDSCTLDATSKYIAIRLPEDWSKLQKSDIELATKWRATTDKIFGYYLSPDRYTIAEVATDTLGNFYLLGQKIKDIPNI